jgi:DNA-binding transcriptional LysR family regulator
METALKERGFDPNQLNITMELGSTQAIKQMVSAGLGITIISSLTVSQECDQKVFKILKIQDSSIYQPLSILSNARTVQTKDERILINLLYDYRLLSNVLCKDNNGLEEPTYRRAWQK